MQTVKFKFKIRDNVNIVPIGLKGIVDALLQEMNNQSYRVNYWNNGERKTVWLFEQ